MENTRNVESYQNNAGYHATGYPLPNRPEEASMDVNHTQQNKIREINIREVDRGFIVSIGCHTFAITKVEDLTSLITKYINNPLETEKEWFDGNLLTR